MITKLSQVLEEIKDERRRNELAYLLHTRPYGGWRGLFDPHCIEWKDTTISEKLAFLRTLVTETKCHLALMVELYKKTYNEKERPDIARAADDAMIDLLEYAILERAGKKKGL